jgi:hypothetical protein
MISCEDMKKLSEIEIRNMVRHCGLQKVKVKDNFKEIMYNKYPEEYTEKDDTFFEKYRNKIVFAYSFNYTPLDNDYEEWFILEDNNYELVKDCFIFI